MTTEVTEVPRLRAEGRLTHASSRLFVAEAAFTGSDGKVLGQGSGTFMKSTMRLANTPGYASRMFRALTDAGINIQIISTSEIRITCIIAADDVPRAVRALHAAFQLETEG